MARASAHMALHTVMLCVQVRPKLRTAAKRHWLGRPAGPLCALPGLLMRLGDVSAILSYFCFALSCERGGTSSVALTHARMPATSCMLCTLQGLAEVQKVAVMMTTVLRPSMWTRSRCGCCSSAMTTVHLVPWLTVVCWTEPRIGASWTSPVRGQRLPCMGRGFAASAYIMGCARVQVGGAKLVRASGKQGQRRTSRSTAASSRRTACLPCFHDNKTLSQAYDCPHTSVASLREQSFVLAVYHACLLNNLLDAACIASLEPDRPCPHAA